MILPLNNYEITTNDDPTLETISLTLFVSGCPRKCLGCQNPELQKVDNSKNIQISLVLEIIKEKMSLISSVCFCGGDFVPYYFNQLKYLAKFCKENKLKTILYTGEIYEKIPFEFRDSIDIIISDPYDVTKKQDMVPASSNQRVWINGFQVLDITKLQVNKKGI